MGKILTWVLIGPVAAILILRFVEAVLRSVLGTAA